jgi:multidrug transporter EmrE-like cation transporter
MRLLLAVLPTILLTSYSQLVIKWRITTLAATAAENMTGTGRTITYLLDPFVISAYVFSLLSSVAWFFVVEKYPVSVAFPFYVGVLFAVVTVCSALILKEAITAQHVVGLALILVGVVIVSRATAS